MDDGDAAQVEQVLALAEVAGAVTLPVPQMRQTVFDRHSLAQLGPARWRRLPRAELHQQLFVGMNADAAPRRTRRAAVV